MKRYSIVCLMLSVAFLGACATTSQHEDRVNQINSQLSSMQNDTTTSKFAPVALAEARESVDRLNHMVAEDADDEQIQHQIYLSDKRLAIAREIAATKQAESTVQQAELNRKEVLLEKSREEARMAKQQAAAASSYAQQMRERAKELENQVSNLKTQETERGLVLTLDDILFAFDSTELKSGAKRTLDNVADFLREYPGRAIMIEGFTDSVGANDYNQQLSAERAEAVKGVLQESGIQASRIDTRGYGERYPVATNNTEAGRQENRRVEIVLADSTNKPVEERKDMASKDASLEKGHWSNATLTCPGRR